MVPEEENVEVKEEVVRVKEEAVGGQGRGLDDGFL